MQDPPGPAGSGTVQDGAGGVQAQQPCIKTSTWKHSQGGCGKRKGERKGSQQSLMDFFSSWDYCNLVAVGVAFIHPAWLQQAS